jgi:hypothetical protein
MKEININSMEKQGIKYINEDFLTYLNLSEKRTNQFKNLPYHFVERE